jgi:predicted peptidase
MTTRRATSRLAAALAMTVMAALCGWSAPAAAEIVVDRSTPEQQAADAALLKNLNRDDFSSGSFTEGDGTLVYRLLPPAHPQAGQRYPLVIVLHGSGAIGADNRGQLGQLAVSWSAPALRERYPAYILAPQFPERSANYTPSPADGLLAAQSGPNIPTLLALVEQLKKQDAIDPDRIYVTGFSMGASAATQAVLQAPGNFAAVVAFSGIAPDRTAAARLSAIPLMIVHGNADAENPIDPDRAMVAALEHIPGAHFRFLEYLGMDHQVPFDMLLATAWRDWLFAQRRAR